MKGQMSLEFLVIVAVSISILLIFMPVFGKAYNSVTYALDLYQASGLIEQIDEDISILNTLNVGSFFTIKSNPMYSYLILCKKNDITITIASDFKKKTLSRTTNMNLDCNEAFSSQTLLKIEKSTENMIKISKSNIN